MFRRVLGAALAPLLAAPLAPAAAAQAAEPQVRVAAISPWVDASTPFRVVLQVTNVGEISLERISVRVAVFGRVFSRSELRVALDRRPTTAFMGGATEPVDEPIPPGGQRTIALERAATRLAPFSRSGVYPVTIALRYEGGGVEVHSAVPYVASVPDAGIGVSLVLPVTRPAVRAPDGAYPPDLTETLALEELAQQMNAIAARRPRVTLAPSPATLDTLADLADGFAVRRAGSLEGQGEESAVALAAGRALAAVRSAAAAAGEIATVPYAPADLPSLAAHDLQADLVRQLTLGRATAQSHLERVPAGTALVPPRLRLDPASARALPALGISGAALAPVTLGDLSDEPFQPENFGPSRPLRARAGDVALHAMAADPDLSGRIAAFEHGVLAAQGVIAETAMAWLELPLFAGDRGLLVAPERLPSPPALASLLDGLARAPWVQMRTLSGAMADLPPRGESVELVPAATGDTPYLTAARAARRSLGTLAGIVVEPPPEFDRLERQLLIAESDEWRADPAAGAALARAIVTRTREVTGAVGVATRQVTLTSRRGSLPVTLINGNDFPLSVRIRLTSARVQFPSGAVRAVELAPPNRTVDFAIEARGTGTFPLEVRVESPDGGQVLATGQLVVRSTAVSAVALLAIGGGVLFLLVAWIRRDRRRRSAAAR